MKHFIDVENINIAYDTISPGEINADVPVIFLHDSLGAISVWKIFPKKVAEQTGLTCIEMCIRDSHTGNYGKAG